MRSRDFGRTWERADGSRIERTPTAKTMDVFIAGESMDPKPGIRNAGAIVVDSEGNPYGLNVCCTSMSLTERRSIALRLARTPRSDSARSSSSLKR